jgi:hypothetical protein
MFCHDHVVPSSLATVRADQQRRAAERVTPVQLSKTHDKDATCASYPTEDLVH